MAGYHLSDPNQDLIRRRKNKVNRYYEHGVIKVVAFDFSSDALTEVDAFFRKEHKVIIPLMVKGILEENIARKLA